MATELYVTETPGNARRLYISAVVLLAVALGLAWNMVASRSGNPLGERIAPAGWGISFQPPARFVSAGPIRSEAGPVYLFEGHSRGGAPVQIMVGAIEAAPETDPDQVCAQVWRDCAEMFLPLALVDPPEVNRIQLAGRPAAEIGGLRWGLIVRVVVLTEGQAHIFVLRVKADEIDERLARTFDQVCNSVEYR